PLQTYTLKHTHTISITSPILGAAPSHPQDKSTCSVPERHENETQLRMDQPAVLHVTIVLVFVPRANMFRPLRKKVDVSPPRAVSFTEIYTPRLCASHGTTLLLSSTLQHTIS
ncbi:unnamed protein product, partial [Ectocarpus sp. 12 AP-2014]